MPWWFWQREGFCGQEIQREGAGGRVQCGGECRGVRGGENSGGNEGHQIHLPSLTTKGWPPGRQRLLVLPHLLEGSRKVWGQRLSTTCSVPWLLCKMLQEQEGLRRDALKHPSGAGSMDPGVKGMALRAVRVCAGNKATRSKPRDPLVCRALLKKQTLRTSGLLLREVKPPAQGTTAGQ